MKFKLFILILILFVGINTVIGISDSDTDGVPDINDKCPNSINSLVDESGCTCNQKVKSADEYDSSSTWQCLENLDPCIETCAYDGLNAFCVDSGIDICADHLLYFSEDCAWPFNVPCNSNERCLISDSRYFKNGFDTKLQYALADRIFLNSDSYDFLDVVNPVNILIGNEVQYGVCTNVCEYYTSNSKYNLINDPKFTFPGNCNIDTLPGLCGNDTFFSNQCQTCGCQKGFVCMTEGEFSDECKPDTDGDGIINSYDNCMYSFNPNQDDFDKDGSGNVCESDDDNDHVQDIFELKSCLFTPLGEMVDSNGCSCSQKTCVNQDCYEYVCNSDTAQCEISNPLGNEFKPTANAGPDLAAKYGSVGVMFDGSKSVSPDGADLTYNWYYNNKLKFSSRNSHFLFNYPSTGTFEIKLSVTSDNGCEASSFDTVKVTIVDGEACANTDARYFPQDTMCDDVWPKGDGYTVISSSIDDTCEIMEICDPNLDFMVQDAIDCCAQQNFDIDFDDSGQEHLCKTAFSKAYGRFDFDIKFDSNSFKTCIAEYVITGFGSGSEFMQDYWYPEICCKGEDYCSEFPGTKFSGDPHPCESDGLSFTGAECDVPELTCKYGSFFGVKFGKTGKWNSEDDMSRNNIAHFDPPAHVSINRFSTGTCGDYSHALTTALRKSGFSKNDVMSVNGVGHAYNLIKFPGDTKYHFVDTTGNGRGVVNTPASSWYDYCRSAYSTTLFMGCYSDSMRKSYSNCPDIDVEVAGCEGTEQCGTNTDPCIVSNDCCSNKMCNWFSCQDCLDQGSLCISDDVCCDDDRCSLFTCKDCNDKGEGCIRNDRCCDNLQCSWFTCKDCKPKGDSCFSNTDCCEGAQCSWFTCKDCKASNKGCFRNSDCCSGKCSWFKCR